MKEDFLISLALISFFGGFIICYFVMELTLLKAYKKTIKNIQRILQKIEEDLDE